MLNSSPPIRSTHEESARIKEDKEAIFIQQKQDAEDKIKFEELLENANLDSIDEVLTTYLQQKPARLYKKPAEQQWMHSKLQKFNEALRLIWKQQTLNVTDFVHLKEKFDEFESNIESMIVDGATKDLKIHVKNFFAQSYESLEPIRTYEADIKTFNRSGNLLGLTQLVAKIESKNSENKIVALEPLLKKLLKKCNAAVKQITKTKQIEDNNIIIQKLENIESKIAQTKVYVHELLVIYANNLYKHEEYYNTALKLFKSKYAKLKTEMDMAIRKLEHTMKAEPVLFTFELEAFHTNYDELISSMSLEEQNVLSEKLKTIELQFSTKKYQY